VYSYVDCLQIYYVIFLLCYLDGQKEEAFNLYVCSTYVAFNYGYGYSSFQKKEKDRHLEKELDMDQ